MGRHIFQNADVKLRHFEHETDIGLAGTGFVLDLADTVLGRFNARFACRGEPGGNAAVVLFSPGSHLGHIHITGNDHGGIAGYVPLAVKAAQIVRGHGIQIAHPAHNGPPVRRCRESHSVGIFVELRAWRVFGAQPALFLDDFDFTLELFVVPLGVGKTVGFQLHHLFKAGGRNLLVVGGGIAAGKSVVAPAQSRNAARKLTGLEGGRAFEHHVFKGVGHARAAVHLVHRAHPHPQHVRHRGRPAVGFNDQRQTIGQCELLHLHTRGGALRTGAAGKQTPGTQERSGFFHQTRTGQTGTKRKWKHGHRELSWGHVLGKCNLHGAFHRIAAAQRPSHVQFLQEKNAPARSGIRNPERSR